MIVAAGLCCSDQPVASAAEWRSGYRAGFTAGVEIGGAGVLLTLQHALPRSVLLDLLPRLPYAGEYRRLQRLRALDNQRCRRSCGACSLCARAAAITCNLARYGSTDYPGEVT
ncbi:MAG: hypothetical protein M3042_07800 [Actinomycetota bacterium]|nr:hypothetical protein [Actinomycetota bacterium]